MDKSPDAFRTITEVAEWLDTPAHVLRFWESRFSQIKPVKRAGGRRYYRPTDMLLLGGIKKLLHDDGTTIKAVQSLLREQGVQHVQSLSQPVSVLVSLKKKGSETSFEKDDVSPVSEPVSVQVSIKKKATEVTAETDNAPQPDPKGIDPIAERVSLSAIRPRVKPKEPDQQPEAEPLVLTPAPKDDIDPKAAQATSTASAKTETQGDISPVDTPSDIFDRIEAEDISEEPIAASEGETSVGVMKSPNALKSTTEISRQDIQDIEALYYSLKMVRNNMKRTGATR